MSNISSPANAGNQYLPNLVTTRVAATFIGDLSAALCSAQPPDNGGGERDRTDDLLLAKQALSQLSYTPSLRMDCKSAVGRFAHTHKSGGPEKS